MRAILLEVWRVTVLAAPEVSQRLLKRRVEFGRKSGALICLRGVTVLDKFVIERLRSLRVHQSRSAAVQSTGHQGSLRLAAQTDDHFAPSDQTVQLPKYAMMVTMNDVRREPPSSLHADLVSSRRTQVMKCWDFGYKVAKHCGRMYALPLAFLLAQSVPPVSPAGHQPRDTTWHN